MSERFPGYFDGTVFYSSVGMKNLSLPLSPAPGRREPLAGCHVYLPPRENRRQRDDEPLLNDYTIAFARLSALAWRRYNGPIRLVTDPDSAWYFHRIGMDDVYDEVLPILSGRNHGINTRRYWASGKIQALERLKAPVVIIDMDLAVWGSLEVGDAALAVAHTETVYEWAYPPLSFFRMSRSYSFPPEWDENALPLNTSIMYFRDEALKAYYTRESIRFMTSDMDTPDDGTRCMVFAEQRILGMCAAARGIVPRTYLNYHDPLEDQRLITHLWAGKRLLELDGDTRERFLKLCAEKTRALEQPGGQSWPGQGV